MRRIPSRDGMVENVETISRMMGIRSVITLRVAAARVMGIVGSGATVGRGGGGVRISGVEVGGGVSRVEVGGINGTGAGVGDILRVPQAPPAPVVSRLMCMIPMSYTSTHHRPTRKSASDCLNRLFLAQTNKVIHN